MHVGNVMSYISFNNHTLEKLVGFDDAQNVTLFHKLASKVENFDCNPLQIHINRAEQSFLGALQYELSTYYESSKTPKILLFSNCGVKDIDKEEDEICKYYRKHHHGSYLTSNDRKRIKINVVNLMGHGLDENYLKCLQFPRAAPWESDESINSPFTLSPSDLSYIDEEIIGSVCQAPTNPTSSPTNNPTPSPTNSPTPF